MSDYLTIFGIVDVDNKPLIRHGKYNSFGLNSWENKKRFTIWLSNNQSDVKAKVTSYQKYEKTGGVKSVEYVLVPKEDFDRLSPNAKQGMKVKDSHYCFADCLPEHCKNCPY